MPFMLYKLMAIPFMPLSKHMVLLYSMTCNFLRIKRLLSSWGMKSLVYNKRW